MAVGVNNQGLSGRAGLFIPGVATAPGGAQLNVANTTANLLPGSRLAVRDTNPIAALGGQTTARVRTTTQQLSPLSTILSGLLGGTGLCHGGIWKWLYHHQPERCSH